MKNSTYTSTSDLQNGSRQSLAAPKQNRVIFPSTSQIYNAVFENSFHPMYIGSGDNHIIKFNEKLCKTFGYSHEEIYSIHCFDIFDTNEDAFLNFIKERKDKGIAKAEITGLKKSGERFPCRISSVIYTSDEGEKRSMNTVVNISKDLSARWDFTPKN